MLQLENSKDEKELMDKKGTFVKGKRDSIGLSHARKFKERKMDKNKKPQE